MTSQKYYTVTSTTGGPNAVTAVEIIPFLRLEQYIDSLTEGAENLISIVRNREATAGTWYFFDDPDEEAAAFHDHRTRPDTDHTEERNSC